MKKVLLTLMGFCIIALCVQCSQKHSAGKFESQSTIMLYTNIDTIHEYHQSAGANLRIAKIPFENKLITIMWAAGSTEEYKIISIDTTNKINPNFKPE